VKVGRGVSVTWAVDVAGGCSISSKVGVSDGDSVVVKVFDRKSVSLTSIPPPNQANLSGSFNITFTPQPIRAITTRIIPSQKYTALLGFLV